MRLPASVRYDIPGLGETRVERLPNVNIGAERTARDLVSCTRAAYVVELGARATQAVEEHFDPANPKVVRRQLGRMEKVAEAGGAYCIVGDHTADQEERTFLTAAFIKVTPSRPNGIYVADLVVSPPGRFERIAQRKHVATALLHFALNHSDEREQVVVADTLNTEHATSASLFAGYGLEPTGTSVDPLALGMHRRSRVQIGMTRHAGVLEEVVGRMEERNPWLAQGVIAMPNPGGLYDL